MSRLPPDSARALRLAYRDLFFLAGRMRVGEVPGSRAPAMHNWAEAEIRQQTKALYKIVDDEELVDDAKLAIIALIDESANNSANADLAKWWVNDNTLQYKHFEHTVLGTRFFDRLDALRSSSSTPTEILEVYMRCLMWGFEGKYREDGRLDALDELRQSLHNELRRRLDTQGVSALSMDIVPISELPRPAPMLGVPWIVGLGSALLLLCGFALTMLLYGHARTTSQALRAQGPESTATAETP